MKDLFLILTTGIWFNCSAQTLTQGFNEPVVGDVDKNYRLDSSAYTSPLPLSITGTNCVWNFANLVGIFPMVTDSFINPSAAIGSSAYPSATFVQHRDLLYTFYRSSSSPSQTELWGATSPSLSLTFTNSAIIAGYPVSYGYNLTDPVSGSFKYNSNTGACNGDITISAASTGTLNLPNGISIANVLCLKSVENLTLSLGIFPFGTFNQTIYNFYMPGKKFPIVNINYTSYQFISGTPTITAYIYGSNNYYTVVGLNELANNMTSSLLFPNPFHDQLFQQGKSPDNEAEYFFYDSGAQFIFNTRSLSDDMLSRLPSGLYFVEIKNKAGNRHQKLLKE